MARIVTLTLPVRYDLENKVQAIKAVRGLTGLGLKEAKELCERVNPGHSETLRVPYDVMGPIFNDNIRNLRESGFTVYWSDPSDKVRQGISDQLRSLVTYCTIASQFDLAKALIDVVETYCPESSEESKKKLLGELGIEDNENDS